MSVATSPARATASDAAVTNERSRGNSPSSDVWLRKTRLASLPRTFRKIRLVDRGKRSAPVAVARHSPPLARRRGHHRHQHDVVALRAGRLGAVQGAQLCQLGRRVRVPVAATGVGADADPALTVELDGERSDLFLASMQGIRLWNELRDEWRDGSGCRGPGFGGVSLSFPRTDLRAQPFTG